MFCKVKKIRTGFIKAQPTIYKEDSDNIKKVKKNLLGHIDLLS